MPQIRTSSYRTSNVLSIFLAGNVPLFCLVPGKRPRTFDQWVLSERKPSRDRDGCYGCQDKQTRKHRFRYK